MNEQQLNQLFSKEMTIARNRIAEIEHDKESRNKETRLSVLDYLRDPKLVRTRINWLFDGDYGHGEQLIARDILRNKRMNRVAAIVQLVAMFDKLSSRANVAQAWKLLKKKEQADLQVEVEAALVENEEELIELEREIKEENEKCAAIIASEKLN